MSWLLYAYLIYTIISLIGGYGYSKKDQFNYKIWKIVHGELVDYKGNKKETALYLYRTVGLSNIIRKKKWPSFIRFFITDGVESHCWKASLYLSESSL